MGKRARIPTQKALQAQIATQGMGTNKKKRNQATADDIVQDLTKRVQGKTPTQMKKKNVEKELSSTKVTELSEEVPSASSQ